MYRPDAPQSLAGVRAVIDQDLASALLAQEVAAALPVLATDVDGVFLDWQTSHARLPRHTTPDELEVDAFPAGSMGSKVMASCQFVRQTGQRAAIGALADLARLVTDEASAQGQGC